MNFMDLYLDSQRVEYVESTPLPVMSLEDYRLYRETQLVILEASNMFDIADIQFKNINLYAEADFS